MKVHLSAGRRFEIFGVSQSGPTGNHFGRFQPGRRIGVRHGREGVVRTVQRRMPNLQSKNYKST